MLACKDCANFLDANNAGESNLNLHFCEAPELSEVLDGEPGKKNTFAECNCVRDFKAACGHNAKWFKPSI